MRRYPAEQLVVDPRAQPIDHKALSRNQLLDADKTGITAASISRGQDAADFFKVDPARPRPRQLNDIASQRRSAPPAPAVAGQWTGRVPQHAKSTDVRDVAEHETAAQTTNHHPPIDKK